MGNQFGIPKVLVGVSAMMTIEIQLSRKSFTFPNGKAVKVAGTPWKETRQIQKLDDKTIFNFLFSFFESHKNRDIRIDWVDNLSCRGRKVQFDMNKFSNWLEGICDY